MIYTCVEQLIGNTPLLALDRLGARLGLSGRILAKLESFNPAGSVKDRVALAMLEDMERRGARKEESVIVEPTSGNTGIGLAAVAAARGYRVIVVMPETMSQERRKLIAAYGAELVLTEGSQGMAGAIQEARRLVDTLPNAFLAGQFDNPANAQAHRSTTGPEIYRDTEGNLDFFVAGVGTGGTVTGVGEYLKAQCPHLQVVAVEPQASPVLSQGKSGPHGIQGIGAGFVPRVLHPQVIDRVVCVREEEAYEASRLLAKTEGVLAGISSGAALHAAISLAADGKNQGKTVVVLLPDTGERYLSTPLFGE